MTRTQHWQKSRLLLPSPYGQQRWDSAYQLLTQWMTQTELRSIAASPDMTLIEEVPNESCALCARLIESSAADADNHAAS